MSMSGCKALSEIETKAVIEHLETYRDKALFVVGLKTGFRISELLSLRIEDVYQNGHVLTRIRVSRANTKGKIQSREVALHKDAASAIEKLIEHTMVKSPTQPLFKSMKGLKSISRFQAHKILLNAHSKAKVQFKGTHCMRKTMALKVYHALNKDLLLTQKALGHRLITSTVSYLPINQSEVDEAILK